MFSFLKNSIHAHLYKHTHTHTYTGAGIHTKLVSLAAVMQSSVALLRVALGLPQSRALICVRPNSRPSARFGPSGNPEAMAWNRYLLSSHKHTHTYVYAYPYTLSHRNKGTHIKILINSNVNTHTNTRTDVIAQKFALKLLWVMPLNVLSTLRRSPI